VDMKKNFVNLSVGFFVGLFVFFSDRTAEVILSVARILGPIQPNIWSYFFISLALLSPVFWAISFAITRFRKNTTEKSLKNMFLMNLIGFACAYLAFLVVALIATSQFSISL